MRILAGIVLLSLSLTSGASTTLEPMQLEKVKKGILPGGGFYTIYSVACDDQSTSSIVSIHRQRRWCSGYNGQLNCSRQVKEASRQACSGATVADRAPTPLIR